MVNGKLGYYPSKATQLQVSDISSKYFEIMVLWVIKEGFLEEMPKLGPEERKVTRLKVCKVEGGWRSRGDEILKDKGKKSSSIEGHFHQPFLNFG